MPSSAEIPANILETISKTVTYVVKNGKSFEERLKSNAGDKFSFLNDSDPHHEYYKQKLSEASGNTNNAVNGTTTIGGTTAEENKPKEPQVIPPPEPFHFLTTLPPISSLDLDIIKLTALFVAKNGEEYATQLMNHEKKRKQEAQFEFLNPQHSLHPLYKSYIQQYHRVISLEDVNLKDKSDNLLKNAYERAQYERQHLAKAKDEKRVKNERQIAYASIDWQDYAIVARVQFDAVDEVKELAVPLKRDDLVFRSLESKRKELELETASAPPPPAPVVTEAVSSEQAHHSEIGEEEAKRSASPAAPAKGVPKGMKIRTAGESRLKHIRSGTSGGDPQEPTILCPITGKQIPESKFDTHLKILLRDPRYKEQQDNFMKKNYSYASNLSTDEVYENIKRMALKRKGTESSGEQGPATKKIVNIGPKK